VPGGALTAYSIDAATGKLTRINRQSTGGPGPCHVSIDATGKFAIVANYNGGSVAMIPVQQDGSLKRSSHFIQHYGGTKVNPRRQEAAHAHSVNIDPGNSFVIINDLGMDQLRVYEMDLDAGKLIFKEGSSVKTAPGAGPRHFEFHPNGRFAYVINELGCTVAAYRYNAETGKLSLLNALSTLPKGYTGENTTADVHVSPNGRFVYGSNRGHNTIAIFKVNQSDGSIEFVDDQSTGGKTPRNFAIHPDGKYLYAANQDSDSIIQFEINQSSGELTPIGREIRCPMPVCLKFMPTG
jgi:6-phosphogluconolactonase